MYAHFSIYIFVLPSIRHCSVARHINIFPFICVYLIPILFLYFIYIFMRLVSSVTWNTASNVAASRHVTSHIFTFTIWLPSCSCITYLFLRMTYSCSCKMVASLKSFHTHLYSFVLCYSLLLFASSDWWHPNDKRLWYFIAIILLLWFAECLKRYASFAAGFAYFSVFFYLFIKWWRVNGVKERAKQYCHKQRVYIFIKPCNAIFVFH